MKIAVNKDYGGFGYGVHEDYETLVRECEEDRTNIVLIAMVETFPDKMGDICIVEIPDDATDYEIDECDGFESVTYVVNGKIYHA
jgi:hypothetical protein